MIKSVLILSAGYPTPTDPFFAFVEQIAVALSNRGIKVTVVAPQSLSKHWLRGNELHPKFRHYNDGAGIYGIDVYQPYIITLGNKFGKLTEWYNRIVKNRTLAKIKEKPDVCYGHFWFSGREIFPYAKKMGKPLFIACGEANVILENPYKPQEVRDFLDYVTGVICVSSKNKEESIEAGFTDGGNCTVIPNAVNPKLFYKKDRDELREKYGYSKDDFIVAYCGAFEHRKGSKRLSYAIDSLSDCDIKSFFIGKGLDFRLEEPECKGILFKGSLGHEKLPDYLNMADVFCLPTLQEGCCNAIVEALACGLPVISSDKSFNHDILNENNSILIDPMDEEAIAGALKSLYENKQERERLAEGALKTGMNLTIEKRVERVLKFIDERIEYNKNRL